ncbi:MAG: PH domain-containing protein [Salinivenus sp.]
MSPSSSASDSDAPSSVSGPEPEPDAPSPLGAVQEPQRLHPLTLLLRVGASLPALVLILLPTLQNPSSENVVSVVLGVLYGVVALPTIVLQYLRFSYRITPKQIVIQKGVLNRKNRSIPIERIQNIQIEQNLVARALGMAKVQIETAGSAATEGSLEYVGLDAAHEIRRAVRSFQRENVADPGTSAEETSDEAETPTRDLLYAMNLPRVMLSGAFRFSLFYLALIFSALELIDPELIVERVLRSQGRVDQITDLMTAHPALAILGSVTVAVVLGWISGILIHISRYYGFRLWLDDDKLHKRHGLFTLTEGTVPLKKVQVLILRTNPLMRAFGWYGLQVQTVGTDVNEQGHRVIAPFAQYDDILQLAQRIRSFDLPDRFRSVSPLTIRRRFVRYTAVLGLVLAPILYFWPPTWWQLGGVALPWWGLLLIPGILGWAVLQYRNHGYEQQDDGLYVRRGVLSRHLWILPTEKFHVFAAQASLFQRRLDLKTLYVDTAGAASFAYPEVVDLPAEEADAQLNGLYRRFKTLYQDRIAEATGAADTRLAPSERPRLPTERTDASPSSVPSSPPDET